MKTILRIAKLELSLLFYSPIAWVVLAIFMITISFGYVSSLSRLNFITSLGIFYDEGLTFSIFSSAVSGFMQKLLYNTAFFIPLLTMGLVSKELSSGSIKLVLSSPVKPLQLVLGKYLAIVVYCFILTLCLIILAIISFFTIESPDVWLIAASIFSFFILAITYAAIGLFISSLTSYQIVAAIGTLLVLLSLNSLAKLGQDIPVLREITHWFGVEKRASTGALGLYSTKTMFYYFIIIALFVGFTTVKINASFVSTSFLGKLKPYLLLVLGAGILGYLTSLPALTRYIDFSAIQYNTVSKESEAIMKQIDGPVKITTYVNVLDDRSYRAKPSRHSKEYDHFEKYRRFMPQLEMEYVYFYDTILAPIKLFSKNRGKTLAELAKEAAGNQGVDLDELRTPEEIKKMIDLSSEDNRFIRTVSHNGKTSFLRMFDDSFHMPYEAAISASLKQLLTTPAKAVFVTGHGERTFKQGNDKNYHKSMAKKRNRFNLINYGFTFDEVHLNTQNIPEETNVLVIADPVTPYSENELAKITSYINKGGNIIILGEPDNRKNTQPIIDLFGVQFKKGYLVQNNGAPENVESHYIMDEMRKLLPSMKDVETVIYMPSSMAIDMSNIKPNYHASAIVGINEKNTQLLADSLKTPITAPVGIALSKNIGDKQQRIMVFGDADFLNNVEYSRKVGAGPSANHGIAPLLFRWLSNDKFPVNAKISNKTDISDKTLLVDDKTLLVDKEGVEKLKRLFVFILPSLIIVFGIALLRKRKQR